MKRLSHLLPLALCALFCPTAAQAEVGDTFQSDGFLYEILSESPNTVTLAKDLAGHRGIVTIPETVVNGEETYTVTQIGLTKTGSEGAFSYSPGLTKIIMPNSIETLGYCAFSGGFDLTEVEFSTSLRTIGQGAFHGCRSLTHLVLPDKLEYIGIDAFELCEGLTSIELPTSLTYIDEYAFQKCTSLPSITIPDSETPLTLGAGVFYQCYSLTSAYIGTSVNRIGVKIFGGQTPLQTLTINTTCDQLGGLFKDCNTITTVKFGDAVTVIPVGLCNGYQSLQGVEFSNSVTEIGKNAFNGCINLQEVKLPENLQTIGSQAFCSCESLVEIKIPESVTRIEDKAFDGCSSLASIKIPSSLEYLGGFAFEFCGVKNIEMPVPPVSSGVGVFRYNPIDSLVLNCATIGDSWFEFCENLKTVSLGPDVTVIDRLAFQGCTSLSVLELPSTLSTIGMGAFNNCYNLNSLTLPAGVKNLGDSAFGGCGLKDIKIEGSLESVGSEVFEYNPIETLTLNCPIIRSGWFSGFESLTALNLGANVTTIDQNAFNGCTGLTSLTLPAGVRSLGSYAFANCGIKDLEVSGNLAYLGESVFTGNPLETLKLNCSAVGSGWFRNVGTLASVSFGPDVKSIGENAFNGCINLEDVKLPENLQTIGSSAFAGCRSLAKIELPASLRTIGDTAFRTTRLTSIAIPSGLEYLGSGAFGDCELTSIEIPGSPENSGEGVFEFNPVETLVLNCNTIGRGWFQNCQNLTSLSFGPDVAVIGEKAFNYCSGLTELELPLSLTTIGASAFNSCTSLTSVKLPAGVKSVGDYAFAKCAMTDVEISGALDYFGGNVFDENPLETLTLNCPSIGEQWFNFLGTLTTLNLGENVVNIGPYAFYGCNGLTTLTIPSGVKSIGVGAFRACGLQELVVNANLESASYNVFTGNPLETVSLNCPTVGPNWFSGIETLTTLELGEDVKVIGEQAFNGCTGLRSLKLPQGIQSIGDYAFAGCSLQELEISGDLAYLGESVFSGNPLETLKLNCSAVGNGWFRNVGTLASVSFGPDVKSIGENAFRGCERLSNLDIPLTLESIGTSAFQGCTGLTSLKVTAGVKNLGAYAFSSCGIKELEVAASPETFGIHVFDCNPVEILKIYSNTIGESWFWNCPQLASIEFGPEVTKIEAYAFQDCSGLASLKLPETITGKLGTCAFERGGLKELEVNCSPAIIGSMVFANNPLETVTLNCKNVGTNWFRECRDLKTVTFGPQVEEIGSSAFSFCSGLENMNLPESLISIGSNAFYSCASLPEIRVPDAVKTIGTYAFYDCISATSIELGKDLYEIGNYVFEGCRNVKRITSLALNPPFASPYTFPTELYSTATVIVPEQSLTKYVREAPWYRFENYVTVDEGITLSHYQVDMAANKVFQLGVYGKDVENVKWTSSNPSVAYVNECGLVVALGITGTTVVTATNSYGSVSCEVIISSLERAPSRARANGLNDYEEEIEPVELILESIGGTPLMLNVRLVPVGASTVIDWSSSDTSVATVENGIVTLVSEGIVDFEVETENGLEDTMQVDTEELGLSGVENVIAAGAESELCNVYDLSGRCVMLNASAEQVKNLAPGFYIIGGKKVMVK